MCQVRPPSRVPAAFKDVECPYPVASTFNGKYGAVNYTLDGPSTGELLVCFHGLNASRTMFKTVGEALVRGGTQVLNFDMYGHGLSNCPSVSMWPCRWRGFPCCKRRARYDLDFFVDQAVELLEGLGLGDKQLNLCGFSFGGSVAIKFADRYPDRIARLVLLSPAGCLPKIPKMWYLLKTLWCCLIPLANSILMPCCYRKEKFTKSMKGEDPEVVHQFWSRMVWSLFVKKGVASASLAVMLRVPWFGLEKLFTAVGKHPRPVLLIWGQHDHLNPQATAKKISAFFLNSFLMVVKGAQHIVIADKPQCVYDAVYDFLHMPLNVCMKDVTVGGGDRSRLFQIEDSSRLEAVANMPAPGIIGAGKLPVEKTAKDLDKAPSLKMSTISVTFIPGKCGLIAERESGIVKRIVEGEQAKSIGVKVGMRLVKIDGADYSARDLDAKIKGDTPYNVVLEVPEATGAEAV